MDLGEVGPMVRGGLDVLRQGVFCSIRKNGFIKGDIPTNKKVMRIKVV